MPGLALKTGSAPLRRSSLTETPAGPFKTRILPLPLSCLTSHSAASLPHCCLIGVDLRGQVLGVDKAVEIGDRDSLRAGVGDDTIERGGRSGVDDDRIEFGVDHRLDLLDLRIGVALGVRDRQAIDKALLFQHIRHILDRAGRLLHPRRDRIDVRPADLEGRLVLALDAIGRCKRRTRACKLQEGETCRDHRREARPRENSSCSCQRSPFASVTRLIQRPRQRPIDFASPAVPNHRWRIRTLAIRVSISQRAHACATGSDDCRRRQTGRTITDAAVAENHTRPVEL